ncbi:MAG: hypothetical protein MI924_37140 [Chloroflexales bacterium]|nr:hypothetical protein [Chloroflexales bacterium]
MRRTVRRFLGLALLAFISVCATPLGPQPLAAPNTIRFAAPAQEHAVYVLLIDTFRIAHPDITYAADTAPMHFLAPDAASDPSFRNRAARAAFARHNLFAGFLAMPDAPQPYQYIYSNPINRNDLSSLLADDPEVAASTGITDYQLPVEEMNLITFSYATVVGSPGIIFDDVRIWASANGILHTREAGGRYVVYHICHTAFGCKYVFADNPVARGWVSGYAAARNIAFMVIGVVMLGIGVLCIVGALRAARRTPEAWSSGCVGFVVHFFPVIAVPGVVGLILAVSLYMTADSALHNQWDRVNDIRPIQPWPGNSAEP